MKIISDFHDYYDGAFAWRDETLLYVRNKTESCDASAIVDVAPLMVILDKMPEAGNLKKFVISFCGKLYPGYKSNVEWSFYDTEQYVKLLDKAQKVSVGKDRKFWDTIDRLDFDGIKKTLDSKQRYHRYCRTVLSHSSWKTFRDNVGSLTSSSESHQVLRSPVYMVIEGNSVMRNDQLIVNPILKDFGFASMVDPYTAFQELSMYVGGVLTSQMNPDIDRSDDLIRHQKGFDKWSFRKPGKKGMK